MKRIETKPTNPKDIIGSTKLDLGLVPSTLSIMVSKAFLEGALKYGRFNWRIAGVRASIYHAALHRHLAKWWNGQDKDPKTGVHHLDNAMACLGILRDAEIFKKLQDDRPPAVDPDLIAQIIDESEADVARLKALFKSYNPHQYTIHDTRRHGKGGRQKAPQTPRRVLAYARSKRHGRPSA